MSAFTHNPDAYIGELRQMLAQGKKRIGFLIGAGASTCVPMPGSSEPLIPTVKGLSKKVFDGLSAGDKGVVEKLLADSGPAGNIETVLTRTRSLADNLGSSTVYGLDGAAFLKLSESICKGVGELVKPRLPKGPSPFTKLVAWIGGVKRTYPIEVFTTNYDLFLECAFERLRVPYFDGFVGSMDPFFDPPSIRSSDIGERWARLWKVHGSLGWDKNEDGHFVRGRGDAGTSLIYPTHLKYDETQKLPYAALIEHLRDFISSADSVLVSTGFSFNDAHLYAVIEEALSASPSSAVIAMMHGELSSAEKAVKLSTCHSNISVYARDAASIACIAAPWRVGDPPYPNWDAIRATYWVSGTPGGPGAFVLGDFDRFADYVAQTGAEPTRSVDGAGSRGVV